MKSKLLILLSILILSIHSVAYAVINCYWSGTVSPDWSDPGDPIGTLTIGSDGSENNVVMKNGSVLEIRMNETGCASLAVFGTMILEDTSSLNLMTSSLPPVGLYTIVSTTGGITGSFFETTGESEQLSVKRSADGKKLLLRVSDSATMIFVK